MERRDHNMVESLKDQSSFAQSWTYVKDRIRLIIGLLLGVSTGI